MTVLSRLGAHVEGMGRPPCGPAPSWMRRDWSCRHQIVCVECGKILDAMPTAACPNAPDGAN